MKLDISGYNRNTFEGCRLYWPSSFLMAQLNYKVGNISTYVLWRVCEKPYHVHHKNCQRAKNVLVANILHRPMLFRLLQVHDNSMKVSKTMFKIKRNAFNGSLPNINGSARR